LAEVLLDAKLNVRTVLKLQSNKNTWLNSYPNSAKDVGMKTNSRLVSLEKILADNF